jgi:hypothetical protein
MILKWILDKPDKNRSEVVAAHIRFVLLCRRKELCHKLKFNKAYINLEKTALGEILGHKCL